MPIEVKCQNCDRKYRLQDTMLGKKFKCKECAAVVVATPVSSSQSAPDKSGSKAGRPQSKRTAEPKQPSKGTPASKKRPATKKRAVDPSSRKAKPSPSAKKGPPAQKRRAQKKPEPESINDDDFLEDDEFMDDDEDFGFGFGNDDDFDDGFDDYDEPRPARKKKKKAASKKKSKKKRSSGGGLPPMTFNFNRINVALIIGGGFLLFFAIQEARLASKADAEPAQVAMSEFMESGPGGKVYFTLSGVLPASDEYVYTEEYGKVKEAWFPCTSAESIGPAKFILYSNDVRSEAEIHALMENGTHTGMVVNDIRGLSSEVKSMLKSEMPGVNIDTAYIFEVGREPSGYAMCILMGLGALALMGGGLFWMFFLHYD